MDMQESRGQDTGNAVYEFIAVEPSKLRCPRCDSVDIISHGAEWQCKDCSRRWRKGTVKCPHCGQMMGGKNV
jgi:Zn finger protein HypA/HybF involved in hydrogenase expression